MDRKLRSLPLQNVLGKRGPLGRFLAPSGSLLEASGRLLKASFLALPELYLAQPYSCAACFVAFLARFEFYLA